MYSIVTLTVSIVMIQGAKTFAWNVLRMAVPLRYVCQDRAKTVIQSPF